MHVYSSQAYTSPSATIYIKLIIVVGHKIMCGVWIALAITKSGVSNCLLYICSGSIDVIGMFID